MNMKKSVIVKDLLGPNKLILPQQFNNDEFLQTMSRVFLCTSVCGVLVSRRLVSRAWSVLVLSCLVVVLILAIWKVVKALAGWASDIVGHRSFTARISGTMFYTIATMMSRLSVAWPELSSYWIRVERMMVINVANDKNLKRRVIGTGCFMTGFCIFKYLHLLFVMPRGAGLGFAPPNSFHGW